TILMQEDLPLENGIIYVALKINAGDLGWQALEFPARNVLYGKLKAAINDGSIPATNLNEKGRAFKRTQVRLPDIWRFAQRQDAAWEWLRRVCRCWAEARGVPLQALGDAPEVGGRPPSSSRATDASGPDSDLLRPASSLQLRVAIKKIYDAAKQRAQK